VVPGSTDRALAECLAPCQQTLRSKDYRKVHGGKLHALLGKLLPGAGGADEVAKFLDLLTDKTYHQTLASCRDLLNEKVLMDYCRPYDRT
jgi:hypothetical protein